MTTPEIASGPSDRPDIAEVKACCAAGYSSDAVGLLLGSSYHPGGTTLTRRLLDLLGLRHGQRLVDVASGVGTSSLLAAAEFGVLVDGVDLSEANVKLASGAAVATDLADRATYHLGDAEALPLEGGRYDAVICECALCTFPDKASAASEMARMLRPGGRVGISDITADRDRLPAELTGLAAWVACIADARTTEQYEQILAAADLRVLAVEQHTEALTRMINQVAARLELLRLIARPKLEAMGVDFDRTGPVLDAARAAVHGGVLGYVLITAEKPCG